MACRDKELIGACGCYAAPMCRLLCDSQSDGKQP
jgi:hypothetical protein